MTQIFAIFYLSIANILFYYLTNMLDTRFNKPLFKHIFNITLIILYTSLTFYVLQMIYHNESFFFEVSPQRKQCLEEQVQRLKKDDTHGCQCCSKGSIGGIPARYLYNDLIDPNNDYNWSRVDAFGTSESITPPTQTC